MERREAALLAVRPPQAAQRGAFSPRRVFGCLLHGQKVPPPLLLGFPHIRPARQVVRRHLKAVCQKLKRQGWNVNLSILGFLIMVYSAIQEFHHLRLFKALFFSQFFQAYRLARHFYFHILSQPLSTSLKNE